MMRADDFRLQLRPFPMGRHLGEGARRDTSRAQPSLTYRPQLDPQLGQTPHCAFSLSQRTFMDSTPRLSTLLRTHSMGSRFHGLSTFSLVSSSPLLPILLA